MYEADHVSFYSAVKSMNNRVMENQTASYCLICLSLHTSFSVIAELPHLGAFQLTLLTLCFIYLEFAYQPQQSLVQLVDKVSPETRCA